MKQRLMTPGPTPVPEETLLELAKPVAYHRSAGFRHLLAEVTEDLRYVFQTTSPVLTLTASGTGGMEAAVASAVQPGGKIIALIAGRWGERWRNIGKALGCEVVSVTCLYGQTVGPDQLAAALAEHPDAVAVCATLCETATGVKNDVAAYGKLVAPTKALLVVDAISALGCVECRTDDWHIDLCVTGSQKALMLPPGLAFVSVSEKAWAVIDAAPPRAFYFDLRKYREALKTHDAPFTPANTLIRGLSLSLKRMRCEGMAAIWTRFARMSKAARAGLSAMNLEPFASVPAESLSVAVVPEGIDGSALVSRVEKHYGVKLAGGQDTLKGKIVRLGHMGYIDFFDVLAALSALELVLLEMGHSVEPGASVAAAQRVMAESVNVEQGGRDAASVDRR
jgi:aspartate aminotransferase-like enzyme